MKLIVGLGNPGPKYQLTRHNIGFLFFDALVEFFDGQRRFKSEFKAETQKITIAGEPVIVCKPQTFMNLSGESVQPILKFYNMTLADLLVVPPPIAIQQSGSSAELPVSDQDPELEYRRNQHAWRRCGDH